MKVKVWCRCDFPGKERKGERTGPWEILLFKQYFSELEVQVSHLGSYHNARSDSVSLGCNLNSAFLTPSPMCCWWCLSWDHTYSSKNFEDCKYRKHRERTWRRIRDVERAKTIQRLGWGNQKKRERQWGCDHMLQRGQDQRDLCIWQLRGHVMTFVKQFRCLKADPIELKN